MKEMKEMKIPRRLTQREVPAVACRQSETMELVELVERTNRFPRSFNSLISSGLAWLSLA